VLMTCAEALKATDKMKASVRIIDFKKKYLVLKTDFNE